MRKPNTYRIERMAKAVVFEQFDVLALSADRALMIHADYVPIARRVVGTFGEPKILSVELREERRPGQIGQGR